VVEVGPEHHLEVGAVAYRESHVGHAHLEEVLSALMGRVQCVGKQPITLRRQRSEQPGLVPEMVSRRGVGDTRTAGQIAQADARRPYLSDRVDRGGQHGVAQVSVVIGRAVVIGSD
jgi:hypothetical protein